MHFDDRLATVLRHRGHGEAMRRIQFRQLLDLLGTLPAEARSEAIDAGFTRLAELATAIPAADRAAIVNQPGLRLRSPRLIALLAQGEAAVLEAAIGQASLDPEQWLDLLPALPLHARGALRQRRHSGTDSSAALRKLGIVERGLPAPARTDAEAAESLSTSQLAAEPQPVTPEVARTPSIGAIVKRIEDFRRARNGNSEASATVISRLPPGDPAQSPALPPLRTLDFATDADGRIEWAGGNAGPLATGMRMAIAGPGCAVVSSPQLIAAFRQRQPLRAARITIEGAPAITGIWQVDATPQFASAGGRFTGYLGRMRRPASPRAEPPPPSPAAVEGDQIRQLLHELRTPVNAIQGFAEVIQQQLFGATPHEYRALAATIAGDAARMLAAFEELERLARLASGTQDIDRGECDLAGVLTSTIARLKPYTAQRGGGFTLGLGEPVLPVAMAAGEAERLIWRLLATLAGAAAPGEVLRLRAKPTRGARVTLQLPASLAAREGDALFTIAPGALLPGVSAGMFGAGFALRLARAEALAAGGSLERKEDRLRLVLPGAGATGLTGDPAHHIA